MKKILILLYKLKDNEIVVKTPSENNLYFNDVYLICLKAAKLIIYLSIFRYANFMKEKLLRF